MTDLAIFTVTWKHAVIQGWVIWHIHQTWNVGAIILILIDESVMTRYHRTILRHAFPNVRIRRSKWSILALTAWLWCVCTGMFLRVEWRRRLWFNELSFLDPGLVGHFRLACVRILVLRCVSSRTVVSPDRLIYSTSVLIQRLMIIQCEHLSLLLALALWLLRIIFAIIEAWLLIAFSSFTSIRLIIFFIEKGEIVRVFLLTLAICWISVYAIFVLIGQLILVFTRNLEMSRNLLWWLSRLSWSPFLIRRLKYAWLFGPYRHRLFIAYALVACVTRKNAVTRVRIVIVSIVSATNIVGIIMDGVAWPVFMAYSIIVSKSCSSRCDSTKARAVTASTLQNLIWKHLWDQVLSLTNLWAIFQTISLLSEENISVIVRSFDNFWSGPPIFNIDSKRLIRLWTLWTWIYSTVSRSRYAIWLSVTSYLMIKVAVVLFIPLWSAISCSEPTKPRGVHLFLQEVAIIRIMNVRIMLQSLHQVSGVIPLSTIWMWLPCVCIHYVLLVGCSIAYKSSVCILLHLFSSSLIIDGPFSRLPIPLIALAFASACLLSLSVVGELLLLWTQEQLFDVLRVFVRWLLFAVAEFW